VYYVKIKNLRSHTPVM